jgi:hypothetical protein
MSFTVNLLNSYVEIEYMWNAWTDLCGSLLSSAILLRPEVIGPSLLDSLIEEECKAMFVYGSVMLK